MNTILKHLKPSRISRLGQAIRRYRATMLLVLAALVALMVPGTAEALQYDRHELLAGQWFRLFTCHWTHWNAEHAFWDILMFGFLAAVCERRSRAAMLWATFASACTISATLWWLAPQLETYRGLSGLDSSLFMLVVVLLVGDAWRDRHWKFLAGGLGFVAAFALKLAYELVTGTTLFVDSVSAGFIPVPLAHAVGALMGGAVGLTLQMNWRNSASSYKHHPV